MRKVETAFGALIALIALTLLALVISNAIQTRRTSSTTQTTQPSGIWAGLVDDLPSGRTVECVIARDPTGSVAITCDWATAVTLP